MCQDTHELVNEILLHIATKKNKSLHRIAYLLLVKQNPSINKKFWRILDSISPQHGFEYVGSCPECGLLDLR